jgi:hypothetical protein
MDSAGNLYIADYGNHRVRKVLVTGKISTVAGSGTAGYSGDGVANGATSAQLNHPAAVSTDLQATNVYIADSGNNVIRKLAIGPNGGTITTVAGNGAAGYAGDSENAASAKLNQPHGVAIGPQGNMAIADTKNNRIRTVMW